MSRVLGLINQWWNKGIFPYDKLQAYIASIYKKGDPKKQENYRPISLLNSIYKIYAALLQTRIANTIDRDLQKTQYGFRKSRSTVIPLACIRRILERAEAAAEELHIVFLDWEKAFDKITREALILALERMDVPDKYVRVIETMYRNTMFRVEMDGEMPSWKKHET